MKIALQKPQIGKTYYIPERNIEGTAEHTRDYYEAFGHMAPIDRAKIDAKLIPALGSNFKDSYFDVVIKVNRKRGQNKRYVPDFVSLDFSEFQTAKALD